MYKNRLQEICQQRGWPLPEYAVSRDGPDHSPCFGATVSVNGLTFDAPDASTSSKDAQGKAALAAVDYLSAAAASVSSSGGGPPAPSFQCSSLAQGNNPMYKSQLEEICRQRMWSAPDYSVNRDGPDHNPRFRAMVTVNGANFDAPDLSRSSKEAQGKAAQVAVRHFALMVPPIPSLPATHSSPSVREAEHDAAKVALVSLSLDENAQEETILYKNLLQELLQKEGFSLPNYSTASDGASHMPIFSSVVEIEGESFVGHVARSKKQAEVNAAKVALNQLKERFNARSKSVSRLPPGFSVKEHLRLSSLQSESITIKNLEQGKPLLVSYDRINEDRAGKIQEDKSRVEDDSSTLPVATILKDDQGPHSFNEIMINGIGNPNWPATSHHKPGFEVATEKEDHVEDTLSEVGSSLPSTPSDSSDRLIEDMNSEFSTGQTTCSLLSNRVRVYRCKPDMTLPKGATLLPSSDDMWVAVMLSGSNHEGEKLKDGLVDQIGSSNINVAAIREDDQCEKLKDGLVDQIGSNSINVAAIREDDQCEKLKDGLLDQIGSSSINVAAIREDDQCENLKDGLMDQIGSSSINVAAIRADDQCEKLKDGLLDQIGSSSINVAAILEDDHVKHSPRKIMVNGNDYIDNLASSLDNLDVEVSTKEEDRVESLLFEDTASNFSKQPTADVSSEISAAETTCSLRRNRVQVYPCKPGMVLPKDAVSV